MHDFTSLNQTACQEEPQQVSGIAATGNVEVKGSERSCSVQKTEQNPTGRLSGNRASVEHARRVRTRGAVTVKDPVNKQVTDCPDKGHRHHGQIIANTVDDFRLRPSLVCLNWTRLYPSRRRSRVAGCGTLSVL